MVSQFFEIVFRPYFLACFSHRPVSIHIWLRISSRISAWKTSTILVSKLIAHGSKRLVISHLVSLVLEPSTHLGIWTVYSAITLALLETEFFMGYAYMVSSWGDMKLSMALLKSLLFQPVCDALREACFSIPTGTCWLQRYPNSQIHGPELLHSENLGVRVKHRCCLHLHFLAMVTQNWITDHFELMGYTL